MRGFLIYGQEQAQTNNSAALRMTNPDFSTRLFCLFA